MVARIGQGIVTPGKVYFLEWRVFLDRTQEWLAAKLKTTKGAISKLERGESLYNQVTLEAIAFVYKIEAWELLRPPPDPAMLIQKYKAALVEVPDQDKVFVTKALARVLDRREGEALLAGLGAILAEGLNAGGGRPVAGKGMLPSDIPDQHTSQKMLYEAMREGGLSHQEADKASKAAVVQRLGRPTPPLRSEKAIDPKGKRVQTPAVARKGEKPSRR